MHGKKVFISVIIPTHNRPRKLCRCIKSLRDQGCETGFFEVHVVSDGTHYSKNVIDEINKLPNLNYQEIRHSGSSAARNVGVHLSSGDLLAFIDDDCIARKDWIANLYKHYDQRIGNNIIALGGSVKPLFPKGSIINRYLSFIKHLDGPIIVQGEITNMASANLAVLKSAFTQVGGFDERFRYSGAEDQNLILRLREIGKVDFNNEVVVYHNHEISLSDFCRKYYHYGWGVEMNSKFMNIEISKEDFYFPYCTSRIDLLKKLTMILQRSQKNLNKADSLASLGFLRRLFFQFLSIIQESCFQLGAVDARETLNQ